MAWEHRAPDAPMVAYPGYLVAPEPAVSLGFACRRAEQGRVMAPQLMLIGPVRTSRAYLPDPGLCLAAVRIHPEWARRVLGIDPRDHSDAVDDYTAVNPARGISLLERLCATRSVRESLRCLFEFVEHSALQRPADGTSLLVHRGLQQLRRAPCPDGVGALADRLGISARHVRRVVSEACGLAPRDYARLERFRGVLRDADSTEQPRWSDLAALHGYADQPHLTREASRLSGMSPRRLHAERRRCLPAGA